MGNYKTKNLQKKLQKCKVKFLLFLFEYQKFYKYTKLSVILVYIY